MSMNCYVRWRMRVYGDPQLRYVRLQREFLKKVPHDKLLYVETSDQSIDEIVKLTFKAITGLLRGDVGSWKQFCNGA